MAGGAQPSLSAEGRRAGPQALAWWSVQAEPQRETGASTMVEDLWRDAGPGARADAEVGAEGGALATSGCGRD